MIPKIRKILYATDLSENSAYAFYFAIDFAQKHNANIIILHVVEPMSRHLYGNVGKEKIVQIIEHNIKEAIEEIKNRYKFLQESGGSNWSVYRTCFQNPCPLGHPTEEILNTADREDLRFDHSWKPREGILSSYVSWERLKCGIT